MNTLVLALIASVVVMVAILVVIFVRSRGGDAAPSSDNVGLAIVPQDRINEILSAIKNDVVERLNKLISMEEEISSKVDEVASIIRSSQQQGVSVLMINYTPSSLSEVREMAYLDAVAIYDQSKGSFIETSGDYPFGSLTGYIELATRDSIDYLSLSRMNKYVYVVKVSEAKQLYAVLISGRLLSSIDIIEVRKLVSDYVASSPRFNTS